MTSTAKDEVFPSNVKMRITRLGEPETSAEQCRNPWHPGCGSPDIELYILYEDRKIPICRSCWRIIAETELEW